MVIKAMYQRSPVSISQLIHYPLYKLFTLLAHNVVVIASVHVRKIKTLLKLTHASLYFQNAYQTPRLHIPTDASVLKYAF